MDGDHELENVLSSISDSEYRPLISHSSSLEHENSYRNSCLMSDDLEDIPTHDSETAQEISHTNTFSSSSSSSSSSVDKIETQSEILEDRRMKRKKAQKRVSWIDIEKGRDSVVFGAVTNVYVADSNSIYDRRPGHMLFIEQATNNSVVQKRMATLIVGLLVIAVTIFAIFLVLVLSGIIKR